MIPGSKLFKKILTDAFQTRTNARKPKRMAALCKLYPTPFINFLHVMLYIHCNFLGSILSSALL